MKIIDHDNASKTPPIIEGALSLLVYCKLAYKKQSEWVLET